MEHRLSPRIPGLLTLGLLVLLGGPVLAQGDDGGRITISRQDCRRLTSHVPDPGVAYRPGVDTHGRAVTPADLDGAPQIAVPETVIVDVGVDLQDRFGFPANAQSYEADARIGTVEVDPDGRAWFNGLPLQDEAQADLTRRCQEILRTP